MSEEKFYAGFFVRLFAGFLDLIFLAPIFLVAIYLIGSGEYDSIRLGDATQNFFAASFFASTMNPTLVDLITYTISIAYIVTLLTSKQQATFGKRIMGIYVGNPDGSKLSKLKAVARAAASLLTAATCGLGFFIVIFTKEKISLHDFICNTRVFHGKKNGN